MAWRASEWQTITQVVGNSLASSERLSVDLTVEQSVEQSEVLLEGLLDSYISQCKASDEKWNRQCISEFVVSKMTSKDSFAVELTGVVGEGVEIVGRIRERSMSTGLAPIDELVEVAREKLTCT